MGFNISGYWKILLQMVLPMLHSTGEMYRNQDNNDVGKDDLIGYTLEYIADLSNAALSGDESKIQALLNKTTPF